MKPASMSNSAPTRIELSKPVMSPTRLLASWLRFQALVAELPIALLAQMSWLRRLPWLVQPAGQPPVPFQSRSPRTWMERKPPLAPCPGSQTRALK